MPTISRKAPKIRPLAFIPPLKPTLSAKPPEGDQWLHELKHDGYRTQILVEAGQARAFTMNGHDWSTAIPICARPRRSSDATQSSSTEKRWCK